MAHLIAGVLIGAGVAALVLNKKVQDKARSTLEEVADAAKRKGEELQNKVKKVKEAAKK